MKKISAVHVGMSGFPFGAAAINKCIAVYTSLIPYNIHTLAICNRTMHRRDIPFTLLKEGNIDGIDYQYTTPSPYKSDSFFGRRISNVVGRVGEFFLLWKLCLQGKIDVLFFYPNGSFIELVYYRFFSMLFRFPIVTHYVEFRSVFLSRRRLDMRIQDWLFDNYFMRFTDGILPISEFLIDHLKARKSKVPFLKVPPMVDFDVFHQPKNTTEKYFLYVVSAAYLADIRFITAAFDLLQNSHYKLHLVVHGTPVEMDAVRSMVRALKNHQGVSIFTKLEFTALINQYCNASALLIPLTNSVQDSARFPQKIAEYTASASPIIGTRFGEIGYYFKNKENAFIADDYDVEEFALLMKFVSENEHLAEVVGANGYETGLRNFSTEACGERIAQFVFTLIN